MSATLDYEAVLADFDPVIGLEVHVELSTATKMFCGCPTVFGGEPNSQVCPVCLGLPGALPVVNQEAVERAIRIGLALNCSIAANCRFARKNYFYPDMPKNFQTSQYDEPIAYEGYLDVELDDGSTYRVQIERAHMEEDAGKLTHVGTSGRIHGADYSLADYNRAGIPLIEIVTKPLTGAGAKAPQVARAYVSALRDLMRALDVSDARMEQGSLRCDANVSLRPRAGDDPAGEQQLAVPLGTRTETKNVNSLRSVERAVTYEMTRQAAVLAGGERVVQETRHWHEDSGTTTSGRPKSDADDYRYFPEPDLAPIAPSAQRIEELRATLPEDPAQRRKRLQDQWGYTDLEMRDVVGSGALDVIDATVQAGATPGGARRWWVGELARRANAAGVELTGLGVGPVQIAQLDAMVREGRLNDSMARQVLDGVLAGEGDPQAVADARGLQLVSDDSALTQAVQAVIAANPDVADKIRAGKVQAAGALIGQVMKQMKGQADAAKVRTLILAELQVEG
ncbi:aspartyl-tRNA(Asn)/glutamyl-tRNA(Gln) amidotransferase subunit B [Kineosphaera limosa]|uniref:Aspartyl/glutamyl-tRNA(Asn/Gln) amidotransferase subunit B n=1 Tax=Kineosphaera limosa NBRC 100340 TaxID=1184609 RepID=K6WPG1_9MICO|nr:Asp-tRNA(Asn)/Glu-tRNA(Gln) amidotransferase subunit GatB [Kineosphaera limosa]NYD99527.1 aspartyl-tRNA(Asn)/glutamyl-tRNA(Gln) amidotransferase subunit B [Kineosphaera limosa]GAB95716.1 aspartyl/glutamyl-tRNA(Asn/Gln) amidotransferase subunit B [Kineosphaera limosa NBRC 100340]